MVHIIYANYLANNEREMTIGGIQTYISNLIPIIQKLGERITIYQFADHDFSVEYNNCQICAYYYSSKRGQAVYLGNKCKERVNASKDLVIFATESYVMPMNGANTMSIQHGISWDKPIACKGKIEQIMCQLRKIFDAWRTIRQVETAGHVVCVDYNFQNWYRSLVLNPKSKMCVIPNFTKIPNVDRREKMPNNTIQIIFARRFFEYRGTRIFGYAIEKLLQEHKNIDVTLAGEGPDETYFHSVFDTFENVHFKRYESNESLNIHKSMDIAVVPTVGSEGTSLSLLEAMASRCAVVCTNVGGMTNIVIDQYNGLMIPPEKEELYHALKSLIEDAALRNRIANNAYQTVLNGFSHDLWATRWNDILRKELK